MKTRPIGERFKDGKVTLEVRKDQGLCSGCYYGHAPFCGYQTNRSLTGACGAWSRGNGESVVFVRVEPFICVMQLFKWHFWPGMPEGEEVVYVTDDFNPYK